MRRMPHLQKRPSGYYYRQRIPKELEPAFGGRKEIIVSLRTQGIAEAKRRVVPLLASAHEVFSKLKESMRTISHKKAQMIAENWRREMLNQDFDRRIAGKTTPPQDTQDRLSVRLNQLRESRFEEDTPWATEIMQRYGLHLPPDSHDWRLMAFYLMQADLKGLHEIQQRERGEMLHNMTYLPETPIDIETSNEDIKLSVMLKRWEESSLKTPRTVQQWHNAVRRFIELKGDKPITRITPADVKDFRDAYKQMPQKLNAQDRALPLPDIIQKYRSAKVAKLHPRTVNGVLSMISSILGLAKDEQLITSNPAAGIKLPLPQLDIDKRQPFTSHELKRIFEYSPVFNEGKQSTMGGREACYWLPMLALYTGARMEELGSLYAADVITDSGLTYIDIYADRDKRVKNQASIRKVPLHRDLLDLGFLDYVAHIQSRRHKWLFPHLKPFKGRRTHYFSKWVNPYLRKDCGIIDGRKVFHSFRHTFKDLCRNALIPEDINHALTGHARSGVGGQYGQGHALKVLNDAVQKIEIPIQVKRPNRN